jgi:hypothetical protein
MRYFIDVKMTIDEDPQPESIGIMAEDGRAYYAGISSETEGEIPEQIAAFTDSEKYGEAEFWAYYIENVADWVPACEDLQERHSELGLPTLPAAPTGNYTARESSRWVQEVGFFLDHYEGPKPADEEEDEDGEEAEKTPAKKRRRKKS